MSEQNPFVIFMPAGRRDRVEPGKTVLDAARQMGVEIESICGGRLTCGKCKVRVENGRFDKHNIHSTLEHLSQPSHEETELLHKMGENGDYRLSCAACVDGDVFVFVPEESRAHKQVIRKTATERIIEVNPAIRQIYVEVEVAELGRHRGDWGRLQAAITDQWLTT